MIVLIYAVAEFSEEISKSGTQPIIGTQINFIFNKVMGKIPIFAQTKKVLVI